MLAILVAPHTDKIRGVRKDRAKDKNSLGFECDSFGFFVGSIPLSLLFILRRTVK
jgi:hypothetical protein